MSTQTPAQKVVKYIELTSSALEKAAQAETVKVAQDQAIAGLIPELVDVLATHQFIGADEKQKAAEALSDPVRALKILRKVATHRSAPEVTGAMGVGVSGNGLGKQKVAADNRASRMAEADARFMSALGIQPTS